MMEFALFELAQELILGKCDCSAKADGSEAKPESKLMRLSWDLLLDLEVSKWEELLNLCGDGHEIKEFFLAADSTDQWLRTVVGHENIPHRARTSLDSETWRHFTNPNFTFHSNVIPSDPYWSKLRSITDGTRKVQEFFPFNLLRKALQERKTLKAKLQETPPEETVKPKNGRENGVESSRC